MHIKELKCYLWRIGKEDGQSIKWKCLIITLFFFRICFLWLRISSSSMGFSFFFICFCFSFLFAFNIWFTINSASSYPTFYSSMYYLIHINFYISFPNISSFFPFYFYSIFKNLFVGTWKSHTAALLNSIAFFICFYGFLWLIFTCLSTLQLFFTLILWTFFAKAISSGSSGMTPKDLLALTELKLYEMSPDRETLLSILWSEIDLYLRIFWYFLIFLSANSISL